MTAFADAVADILADANFGIDAVYRVGGVGDGVEIRVVRRHPDVTMDWAGAVIAAGAVMFRLRVEDVSEPAAGDTLTIGDDVYRVIDSAPLRDTLQITQTVVARLV